MLGELLEEDEETSLEEDELDVLEDSSEEEELVSLLEVDSSVDDELETLEETGWLHETNPNNNNGTKTNLVIFQYYTAAKP